MKLFFLQARFCLVLTCFSVAATLAFHFVALFYQDRYRLNNKEPQHNHENRPGVKPVFLCFFYRQKTVGGARQYHL